MAQQQSYYPVQLFVDYPDRSLKRLSSFFRMILIIPVAIVFSLLGSTLVLPPLLMILFRQKYPRWWFDWNVELAKFSSRLSAYFVLITDEYPSTDEEQSVHIEIRYPDVEHDLNRWMPLIKWFLLIPHYFVLFFLGIITFIVVIIAWISILFTGRYPRGLFDFVVGVLRWQIRTASYGFLLVTDQYPPFSLN
jgi:hypothetical protein